MAKILLDYVFPISVITPTPAASTAFLKQVIVVAKPKTGQEANVGNVYEVTSMDGVAARTDNTNAQQLFNAGMTKVYVALADDLNLTSILNSNGQKAFTILISDDFIDADVDASAASLVKGSLTFTAKTPGADGNDISIEFLNTGTAGSEVVTVVGNKISVSMQGGTSTATQLKTKIDASTAAMALINPVTIAGGAGATTQAAFAEDNLEGGDGLSLGTWEGVLGISTNDVDAAAEYAAVENRVGFYAGPSGTADNMFYAFGKLLSNLTTWTNQQYISMPYDNGVDSLGEANSLFDDRVSFVISDDEMGKRLALFAAGGKAIVAPYISKNLRYDLQSRAVQWISANQPDYSIKQASLLETRLSEDIIKGRYIETGLIQDGTISIQLLQDNFVGSGFINIAEPKALWRVFGEMRSTL